MSLTCPNCGLLNEDDSRFCSRCGFQLPATSSPSSSEFVPPSPPSNSDVSSSASSPLVFVSKGSSRSFRHLSRPCRRQHSGWLMGIIFLSIGLLFTLFLLAPLFMGISYNSYSFFNDFGSTMGHFGGSIGEFFGNLGGSLGEFFGSLGGRFSDFFGSFGDSIGHSFDSGFSFAFFPLVIFSLFPFLFILIVFIAILRSARINRSSQ